MSASRVDTREFRCVALAAVSSVLLILTGCSSSPSLPTPEERSASIITPPRSDRGNPPFYEVFGERYYVLDTSDGYRDVGVASWYGNDFHGKETSSGEVYNMFAYTAAHKTLPIPTWVEVTNRDNGRAVIVKVNDRGPFVDDRIIDLSYAAAQEIDMLRAGTASVRVRALGAPATMPARVTSGSAADASTVRSESEAVRAGIARAAGGSYTPSDDSERSAAGSNDGLSDSQTMFIQVGAYSEVGNAERIMRRLRRSGFRNAILVSDVGPPRELHRVRIGPLNGAGDFDSIRDELRSIGIHDARLVMVP